MLLCIYWFKEAVCFYFIFEMFRVFSLGFSLVYFRSFLVGSCLGWDYLICKMIMVFKDTVFG